jgi:predicted DNA-binding protein
MADETSIKVSKAARERLNALAAERGTTLKDLVEDLAQSTLTADELAARADAARQYLREHMGVEVTADSLAASARLRATIAERGAAA